LKAAIAAKEAAEKEAREEYERERLIREKEDQQRREAEDKERAVLATQLAQLSLQEREEKQKKAAEENEKRELERKAAEERRTQEREQKLKKEKEDREKRIAELKEKASGPPTSAPSAGSSTSTSFSSGAPRVLSGADAILYWAKTHCGDYGVEVTNFTSSWKDGLAFLSLVHSHFPKSFDYAAFKEKTPNERLAIAFDTAGAQGVPPLLDPEDVTDLPTPDKRSILTYLSCLYKGFKR